MGNCDFKSTAKDNPETQVANSKNLYIMQYIIGRGGFGKVWKVEYKKTKEIFAMKIMSKYKIYNKKSVISVMNEKKLLESLSNPYNHLT
jgi:serine/threonine protein kinase